MALGWLSLVDGWFGVALGWFWVVLFLVYYLGLVWWKVRGYDGIGMVWGISGWFGCKVCGLG